VPTFDSPYALWVGGKLCSRAILGACTSVLWLGRLCGRSDARGIARGPASRLRTTNADRTRQRKNTTAGQGNLLSVDRAHMVRWDRFRRRSQVVILRGKSGTPAPNAKRCTPVARLEQNGVSNLCASTAAARVRAEIRQTLLHTVQAGKQREWRALAVLRCRGRSHSIITK